LRAPNSNSITRQQLTQNLKTRLLISLSNEQINRIFIEHGAASKDVINVLEFVTTLLRSHINSGHMSLNISGSKIKTGTNSKRTVSSSSLHLNGKASDKSVNASPSGEIPKVSLDIERKLWESILTRTSGRCNYVLLLRRIFNESNNSQISKPLSRDSIRRIVMMKFNILLTESELDSIFNKYDRNKSGYIPLSLFVEGMMSERQPSDPLIDNPSGRVADGRVPYPSEIPCVTLFRQLLLERSNMLGKTPYDLIHSVGRMNRSSFIEFMTRTLHHRPTDAYLDQVEQHYGTSSNDGRQSGTVMIDLRRMLFDSMYLNDARPADGHKSSLFTALTAKSAIPSCWRGRRYSPAEIEEMLRSRVSERLAHKSPMSSLMRLLRRDSVDQAGGAHEPGGVSGEGHSTDAGGGLWGSGALSRGTVKRIFDIFDVVVLPEDFEAFFAAHDRGDGHVDFRYFLTRLLPPVDEENNPFRPKDEVELQHDVDLAKYLTFLTGKFRTASSFTRYTSGPNARPQSASAALRRTAGGDDHVSGTAGTGGWVKGSLVRESTVAEKMEEANVTKERVIVHNGKSQPLPSHNGS